MTRIAIVAAAITLGSASGAFAQSAFPQSDRTVPADYSQAQTVRSIDPLDNLAYTDRIALTVTPFPDSRRTPAGMSGDYEGYLRAYFDYLAVYSRSQEVDKRTAKRREPGGFMRGAANVSAGLAVADQGLGVVDHAAFTVRNLSSR
jgi:hypothetical protein